MHCCTQCPDSSRASGLIEQDPSGNYFTEIKHAPLHCTACSFLQSNYCWDSAHKFLKLNNMRQWWPPFLSLWPAPDSSTSRNVSMVALPERLSFFSIAPLGIYTQKQKTNILKAWHKETDAYLEPVLAAGERVLPWQILFYLSCLLYQMPSSLDILSWLYMGVHGCLFRIILHLCLLSILFFFTDKTTGAFDNSKVI